MSGVRWMENENIEYTLTMNSKQAHIVNNAVELYMRLKLGQYDQLPYALIDLARKDYCERRDDAKYFLKKAFDKMQDYKGPTDWKDEEWHTLYNIHQAIRYQIHLAEHPGSSGVDSYEPSDFGGVGIPKCTYTKTEQKT